MERVILGVEIDESQIGNKFKLIFDSTRVQNGFTQQFAVL